MAERRNDPQVYPLSQSYNHSTDFNVKRDEESAFRKQDEIRRNYNASLNVTRDEGSDSIESDEIHRKKHLKYLAYFVSFVVFQTGIIVLFSLTVMKVKTPKFRVRSITFDHFEVRTAPNPSFNFIASVEVGVKNKNFGTYKFQDSKMYFSYDGMPIGEAFVPDGKAGWLSTKKLKNLATVLLSNNLPTNSQLGNDLNSGVLKLNAQSQLSGKVTLTFMFKRKKSTNLNCNITIGLADKAVREIDCN
ncbi:late embryogenesis abundant protein At1g64065-like [Coffea arabica]|uniref:Late embryogenesis abundant protein At1g64065-like n=1 Tax=Coffea arabica TaxID=13443 RepID=A0A6P6UJJ2_COFAR|nr:late embryogenesis abundant protein At1g64065-like [Coffea arabica]